MLNLLLASDNLTGTGFAWLESLGGSAVGMLVMRGVVTWLLADRKGMMAVIALKDRELGAKDSVKDAALSEQRDRYVMLLGEKDLKIEALHAMHVEAVKENTDIVREIVPLTSEMLKRLEIV